MVIFFAPETRLLRSGWRLLVFVVLVPLPQWISSYFAGARGQGAEPVFNLSWAMVFSYVIWIVWVVLLSWLCLRFLDRLSLRSLGFTLYPGWWREVLAGCAMSVIMMVAVVALQWMGGGTRLMLNPLVWRAADGARAVDFTGCLIVAERTGLALVLFIAAGAFEELLFRGYPFQTLLRGAPAVVPILLLSLFFGLAHWSNPSRTVFSTINTALAGIWLSAGYLKTRSLWLPTALHLMWNWMMGAFFGLPVSGIAGVGGSLFISTSEEPVWLTGGSYGSEGGAAATVVLIMAILLLWWAPWPRISPEMQSALRQRAEAGERGRQVLGIE
jgi:hypothetical protein